MQPGATNISVEFHVPKYDCVFKAPKVIPSLFSGEKFVMYGIFKSSKTSDTLQGKATLKYTICGKQTKAEVPFTAIEQVPVVPVVHHLAAKQCLLELKESGSHQEMVKLSIESSVQCPQTAFLAVDENNQQPISASMKTYDLYSMEPEFDDVLCFGAMPPPAPPGFGVMNMPPPVPSFGAMNMAPLAPSFGAMNMPPPVPSFGAMNMAPLAPSFGAMNMAAPAPGFGAMNMAPPAFSYAQQNMPQSRGVALFDSLEPLSMTSSANVSHSAAKPSLSSLVALQLANGSWSLTGALCSELGKELKVVENSCPSNCPSAVWATALALSSLKLTYSSQQDEWELVAKKAEAWLKKQSFPANLTLQKLYSEAVKLVKILI